MTTLDDFVKKEHRGNVKEAAAALQSDYYTIWRWYKRKVFAPENGASRKVMAAVGIDLPRRGRKR